MKAIVQQAYGSTEMLSYADAPMPVVGPDGVLIRVRAAGVDPGVWHMMTGLPLAGRLVLGLRKPKVAIRGWDVAGIVEGVGAQVTRFRRGDAVFGTTDGSFAEFACAPERKLQLKPPNLSFEEAAALPVSGTTALTGLRDAGGIRAGQRVLIIGAGGGVGHLAVQLAKHFGAEVTGVCSAAKAEFVSALGADHIIDYTGEKLSGSYDLILDMAGGRSLTELRALLTPAGTLVLGGGEGGGRILGSTERSIRALFVTPFVRQRLRGLLSLPKPESLSVLAELATAGAVLPKIDRTFALPDAAAAVDYLVTAHPRGKIALTLGSD
ncbi:NAD(P)-dependent alcohol dehydrogenase [Nocardia sp. NBC_01327]|uniref:NAD(P)-dependent alcohol dehydrogenase n=1 Tax=Nocardia sp. NBC_01327 TaxID=2903593 RepID=UPI002E0D84BA|nr:NAD(P)-dependent alcohol dehydrogenase [Nocardia sp. NBC_01327]